MARSRQEEHSSLADTELSRGELLRRGLGLGVGMLGVGALAACGGGESSSDAAGGAATGGAAETGAAGGAATGDTEPVALSVFSSSSLDTGEVGASLKATQDAYTAEHPNVTFENTIVPFAEVLPSATTRCSAGRLEDVVRVLPGYTFEPIFPCLRPLDEQFLGQQLIEQLFGWGGVALEPGEPRYFGVPVGATILPWYYNKALFEQAGLDPDATPTTWQELAEICNKVKSAGIAPIGITGADGATPWWMWHNWLAQTMPDDALAAAVGTGELPFNDPRVLTALDYVAETYRQGWWQDGYKEKTAADLESDFSRGEFAMLCGHGSGKNLGYGIWDELMGPDAYGVFSAPVIPEAADESAIFGAPSGVLAISNDSEQPEAALDFIEFSASPAGQTIVLEIDGVLPNTTDVDLETVTASAGGAAVGQIVAQHTTFVIALQYLKGDVAFSALQNMTPSIENNDLDGYLDEVAEAQAAVS